MSESRSVFSMTKQSTDWVLCCVYCVYKPHACTSMHCICVRFSHLWCCQLLHGIMWKCEWPHGQMLTPSCGDVEACSLDATCFEMLCVAATMWKFSCSAWLCTDLLYMGMKHHIHAAHITNQHGLTASCKWMHTEPGFEAEVLRQLQ